MCAGVVPVHLTSQFWLRPNVSVNEECYNVYAWRAHAPTLQTTADIIVIIRIDDSLVPFIRFSICCLAFLARKLKDVERKEHVIERERAIESSVDAATRRWNKRARVKLNCPWPSRETNFSTRLVLS